MIISHKHKFIFFKRYKVAGSSFEMAIADFCGDEDIISSLDNGKKSDSEMRKLYNVSRTQQNTISSTFWKHMSFDEVKQHVKPSIYENYLKIATIRNPFDKAISIYYNKRAQDKNLTGQLALPFNQQDFEIEPYNGKSLKNDSKLISENDVDFTIRFENFEYDIKSLEVKLGITGLYEKFKNIHVHSNRKIKGGFDSSLYSSTQEKIHEHYRGAIKVRDYILSLYQEVIEKHRYETPNCNRYEIPNCT